MGTCCSSGRHETATESCHGHHSVFVHQEGSFNNTTYNMVYRPPHLNERLAPGEAKPRFWLNPNNSVFHAPAVISIAWCQLCQPQNFNLPRHSNTRRSFKKKQNKVDTSYWNSENVEGGLGVQGNDVMMCGDNSIIVRAYPSFLMPYFNKVVRVRLVFTDPTVEQLVGEYNHLKHSKDAETDPMMETSHLVRNMRSLKLHLKFSSSVQGLPEVIVEENHGGVKRLKRVRYRPMTVRWVDLDHRKPCIKIVGEQFELNLGPPSPSLTPEDFPDGNGETPTLLGTYVRELDTCPERRLEFSARLFHWFNQSVPSECYSDVNHPNKSSSKTTCEKEVDM